MLQLLTAPRIAAVETRVTDRRAWTVCGHGRLVYVFDAEGFGRVFRGHGDEVKAVSVTLDGPRLISGSSDKTVCIWDLETGRCLWNLLGHPGTVQGVDITADGNWAISGSDDKTICLWNLEAGVYTHTLKAHSAPGNSVGLTPNGWRAVPASDDKTVRVRDMVSGACIALFYADTRIRSVGAMSKHVAPTVPAQIRRYPSHVIGAMAWVRQAFSSRRASSTSRTLRARDEGVKGFWRKAMPASSTP